MKKWLFYGGGVLTGIVLTLLFYAFASYRSKNQTTWFENPGDVIENNKFRVFQVIEKNAALVEDIYPGTIYLLINKEDKFYYDDEIIDVPDGRVVRQVGIYKYETKTELVKTVPIIRIMDK